MKKNSFWLNHLKNSDYQGNDASKILAFEDAVNNLTADAIQKVAQKYLTKGYILGVHNPEK